jgi:citrate synthase
MESDAAYTAAEAAARLGVSRKTLYAYVSRGLLKARRAGAGRESRYLAPDVDRLAEERARGRRPKEVAKAALDWGAPVLSSAITLIAGGRLYYRGEDAVDLAGQASLEDVAARLWSMPVAAAFGAAAPPAVARADGDELIARFAAATRDEPTALWQTNPSRLADGCGALLRSQAACVLRARPAAAPIHRQCASCWRLDDAGADLVRMALALCADHELNASSFTARCVASTGASLRAAVIGGLAALSGPRHGGMTARIEAFWDSLAAAATSKEALRNRLAGGEDIPGLGHPLYPDGDPRAAALLARVWEVRPDWREWMADAEALTGRAPNIDLALVAVRRHLDLPSGSALGLFALGRTAGWIAHALEQRASAQLIRPRAVYDGPAPARGRR